MSETQAWRTSASMRAGQWRCYQATTDANGEYSIAEVSDGSYAADRDPAGARGIRGRKRLISPSPGKTSTTADIALLETGEVSGTVSYEGTPVANAYVEVCDVSCYAASTNSGGEYSVPEVPEGKYVVMVYPPAPYNQGISPQFTVTAHGHTTQNVVLTKPKPLPNGTIVNGIQRNRRRRRHGTRDRVGPRISCHDQRMRRGNSDGDDNGTVLRHRRDRNHRSRSRSPKRRPRPACSPGRSLRFTPNTVKAKSS